MTTVSEEQRPPEPASTVSPVVPYKQLPWRWKPGQSGNPLGRAARPTGQPLIQLLQGITQDGATILKFLASVMDGKVKGARVTDRVAAARELADRLWGKPVAAVEITGRDGAPIRTESIMAHVDTATLRQLVALRDQMLALAMAAQVPELVADDDEKLPRTINEPISPSGCTLSVADPTDSA